jgi:methylthioribose-1-phosphate isomerase
MEPHPREEGTMEVQGVPTRTIWLEDDGWSVGIIDQLALPGELRTATLRTPIEVAEAIETMRVRGAPLIGAAAAYGMALAARSDPSDGALEAVARRLLATRPTAVNLRWAVDRMWAALRPADPAERAARAYALARGISDDDVAMNRAIGEHGVKLIRELAARNPDRPVRILTHCNAGWLATVDWGTATAPIYLARREGIPLHVWVAETRPRLQGALTAWELAGEGVAHALVADSAAGHLLQRGLVDLLLTGTDRTTAAGDVANKVGTYLKALAARDSGVPFYVAAPSPSIDWEVDDGREGGKDRGLERIPIEERSPDELTFVEGRDPSGARRRVRIHPSGSPAENPAFDVTPARLVTGIINERGIASASPEGLRGLFPERSRSAGKEVGAPGP